MTHDKAHRLLVRLVKLHATATARHMAGERGDLFGAYARLHCDLVDLMVDVDIPESMRGTADGGRCGEKSPDGLGRSTMNQSASNLKRQGNEVARCFALIAEKIEAGQDPRGDEWLEVWAEFNYAECLLKAMQARHDSSDVLEAQP